MQDPHRASAVAPRSIASPARCSARPNAAEQRQHSEVIGAIIFEDSLYLLHGRWVGGTPEQHAPTLPRKRHLSEAIGATVLEDSLYLRHGRWGGGGPDCSTTTKCSILR